MLFGGGRLKALLHYPGLPYTVLLDRRGGIVRRWFGELAEADYQVIRTLIRSKPFASDRAPAPAGSPSDPVRVYHNHRTP